MLTFFYGYQETKYKVNHNFKEIILESQKNTEELTYVKKKYSIAEIKQCINQLKLDFIPSEINYQICLFGSYAKGNSDETSDIDIVIIYEKESDYIELFQKTFYTIFKEIFQYVDVVSICKNSILTPFEKRVIEHAVILR